MTIAPDFSDLIARLEKATGPDRELDQRIYCAAHAGFDVIEGVVVAIMGGFRATVRDDLVPRYTSSIDAALTLVPEGCGLLLAIGRGSRADVSIGYLGDANATWPGGSNHPVPALALCTAALKARMNGGA